MKVKMSMLHSLDSASGFEPLGQGIEALHRPTVFEIFAGAGGMALGFEKAGLEIKYLLENDSNCCNTLRKNRPNWNIMQEDIRNVDFKKYKVDIVSGGFPCQPFSHAGHKLGFEDTRGSLFYEFARALKEIKPKIFIAENVEAIIRNNDGKTFKTILEIFDSFGYKMHTDVLNAVNYLVPQKRKRVIFVGVKKGYDFSFPNPSKKSLTLRDALKNVKKSIGMKYSDSKISLLEHVPPGGCWINMPEKIQKQYMGKSFYSSGGRRGMGRRISWDEPCLTLTCSPGQKMTERCHPDETRPFTVREYARIQTFADSWKFEGSLSSQYKQIGNAVPVQLSKALGKSLLNSFCSKKSFFK